MTATGNESCLDGSIPGDSLMIKIRSESNPICQRTNLLQSFQFICTKSNPHIWATWSSKGFRIRQHVAEIRGVWKVPLTVGHTVAFNEE